MNKKPLRGIVGGGDDFVPSDVGSDCENVSGEKSRVSLAEAVKMGYTIRELPESVNTSTGLNTEAEVLKGKESFGVFNICMEHKSPTEMRRWLSDVPRQLDACVKRNFYQIDLPDAEIISQPM